MGLIKTTRTSDSTFFASFTKSINAEAGNGVLTAKAVNGAAIVDGRLDLRSTTGPKYLDFDAKGNADFTQTGEINLDYIPGQTGAPANTQTLLSICKGNSDYTNLIQLYHHVDQDIYVTLIDKDGTQKVNYGYDFTEAVDGTPVNLGITVIPGAFVFRKGGKQGIYPVNTALWLRDTNINLLRIGASYSVGGSNTTSRFNNLEIFNRPQHFKDFDNELPYTYFYSEMFKLKICKVYGRIEAPAGAAECRLKFEFNSSSDYNNSNFLRPKLVEGFLGSDGSFVVDLPSTSENGGVYSVSLLYLSSDGEQVTKPLFNKVLPNQEMITLEQWQET